MPERYHSEAPSDPIGDLIPKLEGVNDNPNQNVRPPLLSAEQQRVKAESLEIKKITKTDIEECKASVLQDLVEESGENISEVSDFFKQLIDKACEGEEGISKFEKDGTVDMEALKQAVRAQVPEGIKAKLEKSQDKYEALFKARNVNALKRVGFILKNPDPTEEEVNAFLENLDNYEVVSPALDALQSNSMVAQIYATYQTDFQFDVESGVVDSVALESSLNSRVSTIFDDLRTDVIERRARIVKSKAEKELAKDKPKEVAKTSVVVNKKSSSDAGFDKLFDGMMGKGERVEPKTDRDRLEVAFDVSLQSVMAKAVRSETEADMERILKEGQQKVNDQIREYIITYIKGKTKVDLESAVTVNPEQKQALLATVPETYRDTKYAKLYEKYIDAVAKNNAPLGEGETRPEGWKPMVPKPFSEFLNEDTDIQPLEQFIMELLGALKGLMGNVKDIMKKDDKNDDKVETQQKDEGETIPENVTEDQEEVSEQETKRRAIIESTPGGLLYYEENATGVHAFIQNFEGSDEDFEVIFKTAVATKEDYDQTVTFNEDGFRIDPDGLRISDYQDAKTYMYKSWGKYQKAFDTQVKQLKDKLN